MNLFWLSFRKDKRLPKDQEVLHKSKGTLPGRAKNNPHSGLNNGTIYVGKKVM